MIVTSRQQLKQYALRALGYPVIQINVADEQLEDRIDEAIEYFHLYHYDGIERMYLKHGLTQTDIDNGFIKLPDYVYGVKRVLPFSAIVNSSSNLFSDQYQTIIQHINDLSKVDIVNYEMTMQYITMLDQILNGYPQFEFNKIGGKLYLEVNKNRLVADKFLLIECYRALNPEQNTKMYNDPWLKDYVIALFKKQWATNLKKYQGMQLPGGITIDGQTMYVEATQEISDLEESLMTKSAPLGFLIG